MSVEVINSGLVVDRPADRKIHRNITPEVIKEVLFNNVVLVKAGLADSEIPHIDEIKSGKINWWTLEDHYPRLASMGNAVLSYTVGVARPRVEYYSYRTENPLGPHQDSAILHGISMMVPLSWSPAVFYYDDKKFYDSKQASNSLIYGKGDVLLLREGISTINYKAPPEPMYRTCHEATSEDDRDIMIIDIHAQDWRI